jgi:hypothetical protein
MNTILEMLFLRRPRIEYVSSPVCPIHFSASGTAFFDQCFNDLAFCSGVNINGNFLNFQEPSDGLAYNVYVSTQPSGQPFQIMNDGLLPGQAVVFTDGIYWFTINTPAGESLPFPSTAAPGGVYVILQIPKTSDAGSWNLYRSGVKLISSFTGTVVECSVEGWYQATKITVDGETPLSGCHPILLGVPAPPPPPPPPGPNWDVATEIAAWQVYTGDFGGTFPPVVSYGMTGPGFNKAGFSTITAGLNFNYACYSWQGSLFYTGPDAHCRLTLAVTTDSLSGIVFWVGPFLGTGLDSYISTVGQGGAAIIPNAPSGVYVQDFFVPSGPFTLFFNLSGCTGPKPGPGPGFSSSLNVSLMFENIP